MAKVYIYQDTYQSFLCYPLGSRFPCLNKSPMQHVERNAEMNIFLFLEKKSISPQTGREEIQSIVWKKSTNTHTHTHIYIYIYI